MEEMRFRSPVLVVITALLVSTILPLLSCSSGDAHFLEIPKDYEGEFLADPNPTTPFVRKVLFLAIDGLRASKLDNTDDGDPLASPNFESMQANGVFVYESHQERATGGEYKTCPGFIQMTTGKRIETHGVKNNDDCANGEFGAYPIFFKKLKELRPSIRIGVADPTDSVLRIAVESCGGVFALSSCLDAYVKFAKTYAGDELGRDRILDWIEEGTFDLLWYHPHELDAVGHSSGWDDDPYNDLVETFDTEIIGPLLAAIRKREATTLERWMIVTTADHGGHNVTFWWWGAHDTKERDKKVPIIVSGTLIPNEGDQGLNAFNTWDLPATIYEYFNLTPSPSWAATDGTSIIQ